jgi:hypothetical protein
MAGLTLGVFYGCQKEEALKEPQTTTYSFKEDPKLFEDAKAYFTNKYGKTNNILPQTSLVSNVAGSGVSIAVTPIWNEATVAAYLKTNSILIVPIENVDAFNVGTTSYNLVFYRDSLGKIQSKLNISVPDSSYAVTHSQSNVTDFTGCFFQMDMQGKMGNLLRVKDGKFTSKGQIIFGNSVKSNPLQTRDDCDDGGPDCPSAAGRRRSWLQHVFDGIGSALGSAISWIFSGDGTPSSSTGGNFDFGGNNFGGDTGVGAPTGGGSTNTGNPNAGNYLAGEVGNEIFDMTDERATLLYINRRLGLGYSETQLLKNNREVAVQIENYLRDHTNTVGDKFAQKHLSLVLSDVDYALFNSEESFPYDFENLVKPYINPSNECYCKIVNYEIEYGKVRITSSYTVGDGGFGTATGGHIAIIPENHPYKEKLQETLRQLYKLLDKPDQGTNAWVYELKGIGKIPDQLICRSCLAPNTDRRIDLRTDETFKFGIAQDEGTFQTSMDARYPNTQKAIWGIVDFNFQGTPTRTNANLFAKSYTNTSINKAHALILEKILIFNYILQDVQQPILRNRIISTTGNLPPGNPIAK